ncbi:hypothetical protein BGZ63DRAFT_28207 [Mariannaea sp. PMI_226]|nr:hypothetical protein BGZ63DRAFT_28207 [Mariannaea sp. PMI_226]
MSKRRISSKDQRRSKKSSRAPDDDFINFPPEDGGDFEFPQAFSPPQDHATSSYYPGYNNEDAQNDSVAPEPYGCPKEGCERTYRRRTELNKHIKTHDKPVTCQAPPYCEFRCAEQRDMNRHYKAHHGKFADTLKISKEPSTCPVCLQTFSRSDNLTKHMGIYHRFYQH